MKNLNECNELVEKYNRIIGIDVETRLKKLNKTTLNLAESCFKNGKLYIYLNFNRQLRDLEDDIVHEQLHHKFRKGEEVFQNMVDKVFEDDIKRIRSKIWSMYDVFIENLAEEITSTYSTIRCEGNYRIRKI